MSNRRYSLIVTAAGSGQRYGGPYNKIFAPLNGIPVIIHAIRQTWVPEIHQLIVTTTPDDAEMMATILAQYEITATIVTGGPTRLESVQNALQMVTPDSSAVLIHDAARPNPSKAMIHRLLAASHLHSAVIPGVPITDTIKQIANSTVVTTIPRQPLIGVQTPQLFSKDLIQTILAASPTVEITDEAMLLESLGIPIFVVDGSPGNIKVTLPIDTVILEAILTVDAK
jgi:2-C-methyl-D-erythritol 4-phosphate cytidylyltransferase